MGCLEGREIVYVEGVRHVLTHIAGERVIADQAGVPVLRRQRLLVLTDREVVAPLTPVKRLHRHVGTSLALQPDPPLLLPGMFPVEGPVGETLSGDIHGPQRTSQRRIETSPVTANRKGIRHRGYTGSGVSGQPVDPGVVGKVSGSGAREARLTEGLVLHVDRIV